MESITVARILLGKNTSNGIIFYLAPILKSSHNNQGRFTEPGGTLNPGESPEAAAIREVAEETGEEITVSQLRAIYLGNIILSTAKCLTHGYLCILSNEAFEPQNREPQKKGNWEPFTLLEIRDLIKNDKVVPSTRILVTAYLNFLKSPDSLLTEDVIVRHQ